MSSQNSPASAKGPFLGIYLTLSHFSVQRLSLRLTLLLSTSLYYLFRRPQWPPLYIQPLQSGSLSPVTFFPLSPSLIYALPEGQAYLLDTILSPAVGKQLLLSSPYFLPLVTFSLSPYSFSFAEKHQWFIFTHFFPPNPTLMTVFAKHIKTWGTGYSLSMFFCVSLPFGKCPCLFDLPPSTPFFCKHTLTKNYLNVSAMSSSLLISHPWGFSAKSFFTGLEFCSHSKHFYVF